MREAGNLAILVSWLLALTGAAVASFLRVMGRGGRHGVGLPVARVRANGCVAGGNLRERYARCCRGGTIACGATNVLVITKNTERS